MISLDGKQVRIFLKTGASAEGIVQEWNEEHVLLSASDSKNLLLINDPQQNIIMVHIVLEQESQKILEVTKKQVVDPNPEDLKLDHFEPDPTLRFKKLAELRQVQLKEHKKNLRRHMTNWKPNAAKKGYEALDYYEHPSFTNTTSNSSAQESDGSITPNSTGLPRVQRKTSKTG